MLMVSPRASRLLRVTPDEPCAHERNYRGDRWVCAGGGPADRLGRLRLDRIAA
jgi:hypothetical protein